MMRECGHTYGPAWLIDTATLVHEYDVGEGKEEGYHDICTPGNLTIND